MKYFIANWKMNMDSQKIRDWFMVFNKTPAETFHDKIIVIAPSFPYLEETKSLINTPNTFLSAQDVDVYDKGAHTGFTGVFQLKEFCSYIIVGHSERKESVETAIIKRDLCLNNGIIPIVCFVEPDTASQMNKGNSLLAWEDPQNISVNGVYRAKNTEEVAVTTATITEGLDSQAPLIYGGSVNRDNIADLASNPNLNGVLIGNASLDPEHFLYIIKNA